LPVSPNVPIMEFAKKLHESIIEMGESSNILNSEKITTILGRHVFSKMGRLKLITWLAEQEETHRIILNVADGGVTSPWSQRCIRQVILHFKVG
jgi:lysophospholipid hydrolase